jgi:formiminotetrahydrofolate cyclodeaminase
LVRNGQIVDEYTATSTAANYTAIGLLPNASDNATAVLTAATTTPIEANIKKVKDQTISGIGTQSNPWGPV